MRLNQALEILQESRESLKEYSVKTLDIFGSVARDRTKDASDVDILVEFDKPVGLFNFVRLKQYLEEILGCPVDLATRNCLRKEMLEQILKEAVHAA